LPSKTFFFNQNSLLLAIDTLAEFTKTDFSGKGKDGKNMRNKKMNKEIF